MRRLQVENEILVLRVTEMISKKAGLLFCAIFLLAICPVIAAGQTGSMGAPAGVGESTQAQGAQTGGAGFAERYPRYEIGAGDVFDLVFELSPEFNQTLTVQPDGFITLRGVGDLHVGGLTVPAMTDTIKQAYAKILNDPLISIVLKDFQKPYFVVDGQVKTPGRFDLRGDVTVAQAIAVAGGFLASAKHSQVLLFRRVSDDWVQAKILNVKKMLAQGNLHEDLHLKPGDMVFVPQNSFSKIQSFIPRANMGLYSHNF
jgi:protein involved in polysaccharide export with SLBB domain